MNTKAKQQIEHLIRIEVGPKQTLSHLRLDGNMEDSVFTAKNVINARQTIRLKALGVLTPTQALLHELSTRND